MKFSKLTKEEKLQKIADLGKGIFKPVPNPQDKVDWSSPYQVYVHYFPEEKDCHKWLQVLKNDLKKKYWINYEKKLVDFIIQVAKDDRITDHRGALRDRCKDPLKYLP